MKTIQTIVAIVAMLLICATARAADITIDFNGFVNRMAGQVTSSELAEPVRWAQGDASIVVPAVVPGASYSVDFFQNSGEGSSDFRFTVNQKGDGVADVTLGGGMHQMIDNFTPNSKTLRLRTFDIIYNANNGQGSNYFIHGLIDAHKLPAGSGPQTLRAIPGTYSVDNLYNSGGGNEDYIFMVDSTGQTSPVVTVMRKLDDNGEEIVKQRWTRDSAEYAAFDGANVNPRVANVRFVIVADGNISMIQSHPTGEVQIDGTTYTYTMPMTVGSGGVNVSSFGDYTIGETNVIMPDGETAEGRKGTNDYHFLPRLRWSKKDGFYFQTTDGKSNTAHGTATGLYDGNEKPLIVKVTATIVEPEAAASQPATK